ncbi:hypothetical protein AB4090_06230 [Acidithiobacillus sp. IBUN Pt1247-S3]|uniref:hypothetical protein n=1 Tax=Acidithiobacillus sp. IBUN Pt1247-S3 TaxID=3166642 RepID=UPI0034E3B4E0
MMPSIGTLLFVMMLRMGPWGNTMWQHELLKLFRIQRENHLIAQRRLGKSGRPNSVHLRQQWQDAAPMGRSAQPEEIAQMVRAAINSAYLTGEGDLAR